MATLLAISQFHSVAFTQLLQTLHHSYDSQVTEQLHSNYLFFIKSPKVIASNVTKMFQSIWKTIRPGNEPLTDGHRVAVQWLPATALIDGDYLEMS